MSWDDDGGFEDDFESSPQGFRDYDDDWGSSHDAWTRDDDTEQPVFVTNPDDFQADDWGHDTGASGWEQESREDFGDGGGGGGGDDPWDAPYGPKGPPDDMDAEESHEVLHALSSEWMDGGREEWGEPLYPPEEWDGGTQTLTEELTELQLDNAEREAQRFDFADEQGDPEDEADAQEEHNGFWSGLWSRFSK